VRVMQGRGLCLVVDQGCAWAESMRVACKFICPGGPKLTPTLKTAAVSPHSFEVESFDEVPPAGDDEIETERRGAVDPAHSERGVSAGLLRFHTRASHPGLARNDLLSEAMRADVGACLAKSAEGARDPQAAGWRRLSPCPGVNRPGIGA